MCHIGTKRAAKTVRLEGEGSVGPIGCIQRTGLAGSDDGGVSATDAKVNTADGANTDASNTPIDTGADVPSGPCVASTTITAAFTTDLGMWSPFSTAAAYPNVESFYGDMALTLYPFRDTTLVDAGYDADLVPKQTPFTNSHSGVWLKSPLPLTSFDVSFDAQIHCTTGSSCADGLIFAWLDSVDPKVLTNTNLGSGAGMPDLVGGAGINLDSEHLRVAEGHRAAHVRERVAHDHDLAAQRKRHAVIRRCEAADGDCDTGDHGARRFHRGRRGRVGRRGGQELQRDVL